MSWFPPIAWDLRSYHNEVEMFNKIVYMWLLLVAQHQMRFLRQFSVRPETVRCLNFVFSDEELCICLIGVSRCAIVFTHLPSAKIRTINKKLCTSKKITKDLCSSQHAHLILLTLKQIGEQYNLPSHIVVMSRAIFLKSIIKSKLFTSI